MGGLEGVSFCGCWSEPSTPRQVVSVLVGEQDGLGLHDQGRTEGTDYTKYTPQLSVQPVELLGKLPQLVLGARVHGLALRGVEYSVENTGSLSGSSAE